MKKIAVVDNYDSFTYNLVHYLEDIGAEVTVMFNDQINAEILDAADGILFSPGPGLPETSGDLMQVVKKYHDQKPILGVCLGMQALCLNSGGTLKNLKNVFHGVASKIQVNAKSKMYSGLPEEMEVGRYHSWVVQEPLTDYVITAKDADGSIMSMEHKSLPVWAVQYHPESILTPKGKVILQNWLALIP
jgi:anthranilate synthase component 2